MEESEILELLSDNLGIRKTNIEFVNEGGEGKVYSFYNEKGEKKIVKVFSSNLSIKKGFETVKKNSETTEKLIQNTVKTLKVSENGFLENTHGEKFFYQISDFMDYDLNKIIDGNEIDPYELYLTALKVVTGICSLHSCGIAHRDIKLENIMIDQNGEKVKIIDFGFAEKADKEDYHRRGSKFFAALELFNENKAIKGEEILATDIYSLGIVLFTLLTKDDYLITYNLVTEDIFKDRIEYINLTKDAEERINLPHETSEIRSRFYDLTAKMISIDPKDRPTADEVLEEMTRIFLKIEEERKGLKTREKIMIEMLTGVKLFNINKEELGEIAEKNTMKIKNIMESDEATDNLKNCVRQSINKILNNNIFTFEEEINPETLDAKESLKLAKIENHLREMAFMKNRYYFSEVVTYEKNKFFKNLKEMTNFIEKNNTTEKDFVFF